MPAEDEARITSTLPALLASSTARAAIRRQLEQLSAEQPEGQQQPPLTWQQLECACHAGLVELGHRMAFHSMEPGPAATDAQRRTAVAAKAMLQAAMDAWLQLDPSSLKAVATAAVAAPLRQLTLDCLLPLRRALEMAQQQRSPYWVVRCASAAVLLVGSVPCEAGILRAVMDDFSQLGPALHTCRQLLPKSWVTGLLKIHLSATATLPMLRSRLAALESGAASSPQAAINMQAEQAEHFHAAVVQQWQAVESISKCAGCGKGAVGLRACARCRQALYCSRGCQVSHWPQHKLECRPA